MHVPQVLVLAEAAADGGLSGFLAHWLWQVYRYFPSQGKADWLLLILALAVVLRLQLIPVWWRLSKIDWAQDSETATALLSGLVDLIWPWLVVWFFSTEAGQTFFEGRTGRSPFENSSVAVSPIYRDLGRQGWEVLVIHAAIWVGLTILGGVLADHVNEGQELLFVSWIVVTTHLGIAVLVHGIRFLSQWGDSPLPMITVSSYVTVVFAITSPLCVLIAVWVLDW